MALPWEPPSPALIKKKKPVGAKPALLPSLEGSLGIAALPRVTPPTAPQLGISSGGGSVIGGGTAAPTNIGRTIPPNNPALGDFAKAVEGDFMYGPAQTQYTNALTRGWENYVQNPFRQGAIAFGDIDFNQIPEQYREIARGLLNDTTLREAHENPTSTMAMLTQVLNRGRAAMPYQAAAQGSTRGGGSLVAGRQLNEGYQLKGQQALQSLLSTLLEGQTSYTDYANQALRDFTDVKAAIAARLAASPGPGDPDYGPEVAYTTDDDLYSPEAYPNLNPNVPSQIYTPVTVGSSTSFEPKPIAGNYLQQAVPKPVPKTLTPAQKAAKLAAEKAAKKATQFAKGLF